MLPFAEDSRTDSEDPFLILVFHHGKSFGSDYEAGVNETVYVCGFLVYSEISRSQQVYRSSSSSSYSGASELRIISRASLDV